MKTSVAGVSPLQCAVVVAVALGAALYFTLPTIAVPPAPAVTPPPCVGDCNGNGMVTVDEILTMVNIALGNTPVSDCLAGDSDNDGQITVDEILTAVNNALNGCGPTSTATPTGNTPTPTRAGTRISSPTPTPNGGPIWGYADVHNHQFSNLGFGGLFMWGKPYDPKGISAALAHCDFTTSYPVVAGSFGIPEFAIPPGARLNLQAQRGGPWLPPVPVHGPWHSFDAWGNIAGGLNGGQVGPPVGGYPEFDGWPRWNTFDHQQMYMDWLYRAHQGGLQLMVMHAVNNSVECATSDQIAEFGCDDMAAVDRQLQAAKDMEAFIDSQAGGPGQGWYRIVYTPQEARSAIAQGQLAVVLGIEVDNLFGCKAAGNCTQADVCTGINKYYNLGVRHLYPIHVFDNGFGGAAMYETAFDVGNLVTNGSLFDAFDCSGNSESWPGDLAVRGIATAGDYQFTTPFTLWNVDAVIGVITLLEGLNVIPTGFTIPPPPPVPAVPPGGQCNARGLTPLGAYLIQQMMALHIIIDIDHMSALMTDAVLKIAEALGPNVHYPVVAGHTGLIETSTKGTGKRSEAQKNALTMARLKNLGALVSVILHQGNAGEISPASPDQDPGVDPYFPNAPCSSSSWAWAQSYLYAVHAMGGAPVGLSSDFNGEAFEPAPRYGPDACAGTAAEVPQDDSRKLQYPFHLPGIPGPFPQYQMSANRQNDYNFDGVAHVGLVPDFIADLWANGQGLTTKQLTPLFHSAEAYIELWERVESLQPFTPCVPPTPTPTPTASTPTPPASTPGVTPTPPGGCSACASMGETCCSGECTDTSSDPNNCGGCGNVCSACDECVSGACTPTCRCGTCGDPHLTTFDGLHYDFQAVGEFVLVQSLNDSLAVQVRTAPWPNSSVALNSAVAMRVGTDRVAVYTVPIPSVYVNGVPISASMSLAGGGSVNISPGLTVVGWPDGSQVASAGAYAGSLDYLDIGISLAPARQGKVRGLLGDADGITGNDLVSSNGVVFSSPLTAEQLYDEFGASWRITQAESLFDYFNGDTTATFTDLTFPEQLATVTSLPASTQVQAQATCIQAGVTDPTRLDDCIVDVGFTGERAFAASAAKAPAPKEAVTVVSCDPSSPVCIGPVSAQFFPNDSNLCAFGVISGSPAAFAQNFSALNFNADPAIIPCTPAVTVNADTRPFTDVVPQSDGSCETVVAQGSGQQAGLGALGSFFAAFTGSFIIPTAGDVTFTIYHDDGWILGVGDYQGNYPSYVSGPMENAPAGTALIGHQVVGAYNEGGSGAGELVVRFPTAGVYPFEFDYTECNGDGLQFTVTANGEPIPRGLPD